MTRNKFIGETVIKDYLSRDLSQGNADILTLLTPPVKFRKDAVPLHKIFSELRLIDRDFPYIDFDFEKNHWLVVPETIERIIDGNSEDNKLIAYVKYESPLVNINTILRLLNTCGWKVTVRAWKAV